VAGQDMVVPREFEDDERKTQVCERNRDVFLGG